MQESTLFKTPENMPLSNSDFLTRMGGLVNSVQGWRFEGEMANEKKLIVALAPHTSNWDFFVGVPLMLKIRARVSILMKREAFFWPFKKLLQGVGFVPVDRGQASGVIPTAIRHFQERDEFWLVITPEGTRTRGKHWKKGFLRISKEANVPIQLLGIDYPSKRLEFGPIIYASDDLEADISRCQAFTENFTGRY